MSAGAGFAIAKALGGKPDGGLRTFMGKCPCPLHGRGLGDRTPSLRIREDAGGAVELTCLAGCAEADVRRHVQKVAARRRIVLPAATSGGNA